MRGLAKAFFWISFWYMVAMQLFQTLVITLVGNSDYSPWTMVGATVLMVVSALVFYYLPKWKIIPFVFSLVAALLFIAVAIQLHTLYPPQLGTDGTDIGMTAWRLFYRHLTPLFVPVSMGILFTFHCVDVRKAKKKADQEAPDHYLTLNIH